MKTTPLAIAAAMAAGTLAHAQDAVQWRVEDGGNGHWYRWVPYGSFDTWTELASSPTPIGAHLATITSAEEEGFVRSLFESGSCVPCGLSSIFVGAYQDFSDPGYAEPAGGWRWVTGEPWSYTNWYSGEPNDSNGQEHYMCLRCAGQWNDGSNELPCSAAAVIEWSADCNGDGIVDFGQCRDGSLPDYNGNNIPDCCEQGVPCEVGNYPVQWRMEDGGNGRWYQVHINSNGMDAADASNTAHAMGAALLEACGAKFDWFYQHLVARNPSAWRDANNPTVPQWHGPYIGLTRIADTFVWPNGEACVFDRWDPGEPTNVPQETAVMFFVYGLPPHNRCHDVPPSTISNSAALEWSADCNGDGIVDYGQILLGELADANANGVPDLCECDADINDDDVVNGADISVLLGYWGQSGKNVVGDITGDGVVNGADLAQLLGSWGECP